MKTLLKQLIFSKYVLVNKIILEQRMKEKGMCGKFGNWLHNFLSGREQHVIANNVKYFATEVTICVPQGKVLGPLLFLLLLDSISDINISGVIRPLLMTKEQKSNKKQKRTWKHSKMILKSYSNDNQRTI